MNLSTQVIDDHSLSLSLNGYIGRCGCHEILIQRSFNVLFLANFCQLLLHSLSRPLFRKLKNSSKKCQSLWQVKENGLSFNDLLNSFQHLLRLFSVLSIHLYISLSLFCPKHNSRRRSLLMRVLSHSDTHHLNRHMVGCGCHEILIPC